METKTDRAFEKIKLELDSMATVEQQNDYIQNYVVGSTNPRKLIDIINSDPELSKKVNDYMMGAILTNMGNPEVSGYSLDKNISDEKILETLDRMKVNEDYRREHFPTQEAVDQLYNATKEHYKKDQALKIKEKNIRHCINRKVEEFQDESVGSFKSLKNLAKMLMLEYDPAFKPTPEQLERQKKRTEDFYSSTGRAKYNPMDYIPGVSTIMKIGMQIPLGAMDWGTSGELDFLQNYFFEYNPETGQYGKQFYDTDIAPLQEELQKSIDERQNLAEEYKPYTDLIDEHERLQDSKQENRAFINSTGFDEALNYMGIEDLTKLLEGKE